MAPCNEEGSPCRKPGFTLIELLVAVCFILLPLELTAQNCVSLPSGLVGWWRAEGDALDFVGGNNGMLINGATFDSGEVDHAFLFAASNSAVVVPASSSLDVGMSDGFTVEC